MAHFWLLLTLPESHSEKVPMQRMNDSLWRGLQRYRERGVEDTVNYEGYLLHLPSFSITGKGTVAQALYTGGLHLL